MNMYEIMQPGCIYRTKIFFQMKLDVANALYRELKGDWIKPWKLVYVQWYPAMSGHDCVHLKLIFEKDLFK